MENLKEVICIVNPDDQYNINQHPNPDNDYCITPYEVKALKERDREVNVPDKYIKEGIILMKRPGTSKEYYYRTSASESEIVRARISNVELILSYLGASHSTMDEEKTTTQEKNTDVKVDAEVDVPAGGVNVKNNTEVSKKNAASSNYEIKSSSSWKGCYTRETFKMAVELAKSTGLYEDEEIKNLIEMRNPDHPNKIEKKTRYVRLREDLKKQIEVAEKLSVNVQQYVNAKIEVDVKTDSHYNIQETCSFCVDFGALIEDPQKVLTIEANSYEDTTTKKSYKALYIALCCVATTIAVAACVFFLL